MYEIPIPLNPSVYVCDVSLMAVPLTQTVRWRPGRTRGPLCWPCEPTWGYIMHAHHTMYKMVLASGPRTQVPAILHGPSTLLGVPPRCTCVYAWIVYVYTPMFTTYIFMYRHRLCVSPMKFKYSSLEPSYLSLTSGMSSKVGNRYSHGLQGAKRQGQRGIFTWPQDI